MAIYSIKYNNRISGDDMKKGFTLIELIASLAIFSITMVSISTAYEMAISIRVKNQNKIETMNYAKSAAEKFRACGVDKIDKFFGDSQNNVSQFIYFNNNVNKDDDFNGNNGFGGWLKNSEKINGDNASDSNYICPSGKEYGMIVMMNRHENTLGQEIYSIYIKVWKAKAGKQSESIRDICESR